MSTRRVNSSWSNSARARRSRYRVGPADARLVLGCDPLKLRTEGAWDAEAELYFVGGRDCLHSCSPARLCVDERR